MAVNYEDWEDVRLRPGLCLIRPVEPPKRDGAIIIPDTVGEWNYQEPFGLVLKAGEPVHGQELGFTDGDWVVYERGYSLQFETDDRVDLDLIRHEHVMGKVVNGEIVPIGDHVLLVPNVLKNITDGGIHIPENYTYTLSDAYDEGRNETIRFLREAEPIGTVYAIGESVDGFEPMDKVVFGEGSGLIVNDTRLLVKSEHVLAVLEA